jgi:hypothetical protein
MSGSIAFAILQLGFGSVVIHKGIIPPDVLNSTVACMSSYFVMLSVGNLILIHFGFSSARVRRFHLYPQLGMGKCSVAPDQIRFSVCLITKRAPTSVRLN